MAEGQSPLPLSTHSFFRAALPSHTPALGPGPVLHPSSPISVCVLSTSFGFATLTTAQVSCQVLPNLLFPL